jgi:hypothetical protein
MALILLLTVLPSPALTEEDAIAIVAYHLRRNRTARTSHAKTWRKRHKNVKYKVLL